MKRVIILMLVALAACSKSEISELTQPASGDRVVVSATIGSNSSRVAQEEVSSSDGNYVKVEWMPEGEQFAVLCENGTQVVTFTQTADKDDSPSLFEGELPTDGQSSLYYAYYPAAIGEALSGEGLPATLFTEQDGTLNEDMCIMGCESDGTKFEFKHLMSIINPTFKVGDIALDSKLIARISLSSDCIPTASWAASVSDMVSVKAQCDECEDIYLYVSTVVETDAEHREFAVEVETSDAKLYKGQLVVPDGKSLELGKFYTPTITLTQQTAQVYNHDVVPTSESDLLGDGSEDNPYRIFRAGDLAWLLETAEGMDGYGRYYALESDFEIESDEDNPWMFASDPTQPFLGTFDGQGHTITGTLTASEYAVLAGFVGANGGVIKDLNVDATVVSSGTLYDLMGVGLPIGGVGAVAGLNQGMIDGCTSGGEIICAEQNDNGLSAAGGLVGVNVGIISNSTNTATVEAAAFDGRLMQVAITAGGIAGGIAAGAITGCTNEGTVIGGTSANMAEDPDWGVSATAGIVGMCMPSADIVISDCHNEASIIGAGTRDLEELANDTYAAGVVGMVENTNVEGATVTITGCSNSAPVTGGVAACQGDTFVGGIVGWNDMANISNCINTAAAVVTAGDAMATQTSGHNYEAGYCYVGGIVGNHRGHMDDNQTWVITATISGCKNYATVNGCLEAVRCWQGGIAGCNEGGHCVIEQCENHGTINGRGSEELGNLYIAGIAGMNNGSAATIADCYNYGAVIGGKSGYDNHTAGITAYHIGSCAEPGYSGWIARVYGCTNGQDATITPGEYLGYGNPDYIDELWITGSIVGYNYSLVCNCCKDLSGFAGKLVGYGLDVVSGEHDNTNHQNIPEN